MVRIVHLADSHFCESSRFEECCALHDWIADWVAQTRPDVVVHAGDVYERASTPRERLAAADFVARCADYCPVVIVRGNHDRAEDLKLLEHLRYPHPIIVRETPDVVTLRGIDVACLPWPRKGELLAALGDVPQDHAAGIAQDALRCVLMGMAAQKTGKPSLLVAHAMVRGSVTSHGQPLVGHDMELGLEDLALAGCDGVALGHIHAHQSWSYDGHPIVYSGSPRRTAFGEREAKGFVVWSITEQSTDWEFVELPTTPMHHVEARFSVGDEPWCFTENPIGLPRGAEIRFRYHVASEHREQAARAAAELRDRWREEGAILVKLEPIVEVETRARAPEVAQARTLREQLDAYWESKGDVPQRRESIQAKLAGLEEQAIG